MDSGGRELFRHARVALAAGTGQVGMIDGRSRVARRKNVVDAMAAGAVRYDLRSSARCQAMIAGQVCGLAPAGNAELLRESHAFMAARARGLRQVLRRNRRTGIEVRLDRVNSVTIGAYRRLPVALRNGLSVDALLEVLRDRVVAFPAGQRHVELEDRGLGVLRVENLVRAVAIGADRGLLGTVRNGVSMHTLLVGRDHLRALPAIFHYKFL